MATRERDASAAARGREDGCPAIDIKGATKEFSGTLALRDVDVRIDAGEIHALVGENGAGKSTLLGALSGRLPLTAGTVTVHGQHLPTGDPRASHRAGIAAVYQELTLVPDLSATANTFLGQTMSRGPVLSDGAMRRRFVELCDTFEASIPPNALARELPLADQQIVEILRGVQSGARIVLFDEPSAALSEAERDSLWKLLRQLRSRGSTVVLVSHNLEEVLMLSDTVTVLRDGKLVTTRTAQGLAESDLVRAMVGRDVEVSASRTSTPSDEILMKAEGVNLPRRLHNVSLTVRAGEILGLAGLAGSGRSSLLRALAGLEPAATGELTINGKRVPWPRSVRRGLAAGLAFLTENRKSALVGGMSVGDNLFLGAFSPLSRLGFIADRKKSRVAKAIVDRFRLRGGDVQSAIASLSGGNQQKVLLGKWVERAPRILLVDEPTRGIDVAAKAEVLETLDQLSASGMAIVMASSELEEVIALSDRLLVFRHGRVVAELDRRTTRFDKRSVLAHAFEVEVGACE